MILGIGLVLGGITMAGMACGQRQHTQDTGFGSAKGAEAPRAKPGGLPSTFETDADRAKRGMPGDRAGMTPGISAPPPTREAAPGKMGNPQPSGVGNQDSGGMGNPNPDGPRGIND